MPDLPWMPPSWSSFFPSGGLLRPPYLREFPYPVLYPSHGQHALPSCVPSRVATLPPRDLSACFSYASLGYSHQTSLEPQTTRTAMEQQVNPSIMSIQNLLTPRVIPTSSAPQKQQRDVNQINCTFSNWNTNDGT